ncbi:HlyD family secretion protein [Cupriavidus sp. UYPR2.512]|uniref:HlyD family secretion protein n=1 Tax=Cupriavidus sp. UYPR2.512 TaxID=1080187 RepID=UPI0003816B47|nr:HlyD family efflux transporter periplasmic adaptor subunit [Cupriavidus sp. UYPR2.512]UIF87644.1 HlyD family efflux transporter periplasmic adaptor subunit [Cupriavidus necator]
MKKSIGWALAAIALIAVIGTGIVWERDRGRALPDYVVHANGRLELARVDVAVKYGGRIVDLPVHEGDVLVADAVVAREDNDELRAQLDAAKAARERAVGAAIRAAAQLDASVAQVRLARLEVSQAEKLFDASQISAVERDRRRLALEGAHAGEGATRAARTEAQAAVEEADAQIARFQAVLADTTLRAPLAGRVEYRVVEVGTVLPAGGRVVSMLNPDDIYFAIFLPGPQAGELAVGADARIVLDAFPHEPIAARIEYVSDDAQFTPKYVETASERAKLMYRVKLQLPLDVARKLASRLKGGMTGEGYVRIDPSQPWPRALAVRGS